MGVDNLKEFGVMFILGAFLFASLLFFSTGFTAQNNPDALGDSADKFGQFESNITSTLVATESDGNLLLNISAESDPEVSDLGSRDSVATSYKVIDSSGGIFNQFRLFVEWVIPGSNGVFIMAVLAAIFTIAIVYFAIKLIRNIL